MATASLKRPIIPTRVPTDISKAISNNAYIQFTRYPELSYIIKSMALPSLTTGETMIQMPQHFNYSIPSVTSTADELTIMWFLDENYITYFNLVNWLYECRVAADLSTVMSDATIVIVNNAKTPIIKVTLRDCWVSNVAQLDYDTYDTTPIDPFFTLKVNGMSWKYLDPALDKYSSIA